MEEKESKSNSPERPVETERPRHSTSDTGITVTDKRLNQTMPSRESHGKVSTTAQNLDVQNSQSVYISPKTENIGSNVIQQCERKTAKQDLIEQNSSPLPSTENSQVTEAQNRIGGSSEIQSLKTETNYDVIQSSVGVIAQQNDVSVEPKYSHDTNAEDENNAQGEEATSSQSVLHILDASVSTLLEIFPSKDTKATEENPQVTEMMMCLQNFFTHGLKKKLCQSVMDIATQRQQQNTPIAVLTVKEFIPVLWDYLKEALDQQTVLTFSGLEKVKSDAGRSKAWICDVLNSNSLGQVLTSVFREKSLLEKYYEDFASVRNVESKKILAEKVGNKLKAINFTLEVDSARHDPHESEVIPKKEKVWHYEIHAPWPGDNQENRDSEESSATGTSSNDVINQQQATPFSSSSQQSSQIENLNECNSQLQQLPPQVFTQLANYDPQNQQQLVQTSQSPILPANQYYHPSSSVAMGSNNQHVPSQLLYVEGNHQMVSVASSSHNQNDVIVEHYHQAPSSHIYQMTPADSGMSAINSPVPGHPGVAIEGQHEQRIYTPSNYMQQFHPINIQTNGNIFHRNPSPSFMYQQRQQTLPKIEELMAPPPSTNRNSQQRQEYTNNSGNMIHHGSAPPPATTSYYSVPHPAVVSQHHRPLSGPHYEPISPVVVETPQMQMYHAHAQHSQEGGNSNAMDNNLQPTDQPIEVTREEPPVKRKRPKKDKVDGDETQVSLMPIPKEDGTGSDSATEGCSKRISTGRGRGRPRQRPKIQGLPPPQDKEEAKEQTATFHRVYERVRRTEIKKGYDTLENLIPFHLRSDILGKKKNFSTTDVLNCARDYIEELKSDEVQHQIIITQMENERQMWKNKLRKLTMEAINRNRILLSNESLPEFDTMEYKTSLSRFIPHVCLPNIGIQTDVFQQLPKKQHPVVTHASPQQGVVTSGTVSENYNPPREIESHEGGESNQVATKKVTFYVSLSSQPVLTTIEKSDNSYSAMYDDG